MEKEYNPNFRYSYRKLLLSELKRGDRHCLGTVHISSGCCTSKDIEAGRFLDAMRLLNRLFGNMGFHFDLQQLTDESLHYEFDPLQAWLMAADTELKGLGRFLAPPYVRDLLYTFEASLNNLMLHCPKEVPLFLYGVSFLLLLSKAEYGDGGYKLTRQDAVVIGKIVEEHGKCAKDPKNLCLVR